MEKTNRGFDYMKFEDTYGSECSLQKSSSAMEPKIWFGVNDVKPQIMVSDAIKLGLPTNGETNGWIPFKVPEEVMFSDRMHLNQRLVNKLIPYLIEFIDTGELEGGYDYDFEKNFAINSFSDDYELGDFEDMKEEIDENIKRIKESLEKHFERVQKLKKYVNGLELANKNLDILIEKFKDDN